ncbi:ferric reductase transmembrane component 3 [Diplogelasinospora grovesii]|uniref:Ferric reductase transmembrane component 3 n=1 Tax=Diplogelasinospora grovesii TaxID=303347 RepID=A0AAN6MW29_9PEZI|nr:ferric reductase transmembrane component 3 [Diplogelasinospora grovesii]
MSLPLVARMIQNFTGETNLEHHWGYADRVVPCKNDAGSCAYLDSVYNSHDLGMLCSGIFWATIGGILFVWGLGRRIFSSRGQEDLVVPEPDRERPQTVPRASALTRLRHSIATTSRTYLLPNSVLVLAMLLGYLAIWAFVGIVYATWITPVKNPPGVFNTRTSLGPWADRIGVLAYALTPLSVLLASRESLLSLVTGVPYTSFMFLHRWTGYVIILQSALHTIGWCVVETRLYQPQPAVWNTLIAQQWMVWGLVAMVLLVIMWFFSLSWTIRNVTGYEFFRKSHYVLAMVYIGAVIGHWVELQCFLVPGLVLWLADRFARLVRTGLLHYGYNHRWGFAPAQADAIFWADEKHGDIVRLDFKHPQAPWKIGQHFYLCFPESSIWQSHPFTPLSLPIPLDSRGRVQHSYIFRAKKGETRKMARLLTQKAAIATMMAGDKVGSPAPVVRTPVVLQGPYGESIIDGLAQHHNVLCVAGGTGITYVLPVLLGLAREQANPGRRIELIWAVKRQLDLEWVRPELGGLQRLGSAHCIRVRIFITDDETTTQNGPELADEESTVEETTTTAAAASSASSADIPLALAARAGRPDLMALVHGFVDSVTAGPTRVFASGPPAMIGALRCAVAECNSGPKVWKGDQRGNVELASDDRMEW